MIREVVLEEAEIIRHSGEIPEVALWNSLFYLTAEEDGPKLELSSVELRHLKKAVVERYLMIIERDLTAENIGKSHYRGVKRAMVNWQRLKVFARREGFSLEALRMIVLKQFRNFWGEISAKGIEPDVSQEELSFWLKNELAFWPESLLGGGR